MESNNKLKETNIKNRTCYYFDDMININDLDRDNILLGEKTHENNIIYDVAYQTLYGAKPLNITSYKVYIIKDGYIIKNDRTKFLGLFNSVQKYERTFDRTQYFVMLKSNISKVYFRKYMKIKINSDED